MDDHIHIELKLTMTDVPSNISYTASGHSSCYDVSIFENGDGVCLTNGLSNFQVQPQAGIGIATRHCSFREKPVLSKYNFFLIGLIHLLSPHGFYDLHAAGLFRDGIGCLFLGESGSGKSSTALSLVRQDWHYVSDDALLLRPSPDGVEALSFRKKFFIDPCPDQPLP